MSGSAIRIEFWSPVAVTFEQAFYLAEQFRAEAARNLGQPEVAIASVESELVDPGDIVAFVPPVEATMPPEAPVSEAATAASSEIPVPPVEAPVPAEVAAIVEAPGAPA